MINDKLLMINLPLLPKYLCTHNISFFRKPIKVLTFVEKGIEIQMVNRTEKELLSFEEIQDVNVEANNNIINVIMKNEKANQIVYSEKMYMLSDILLSLDIYGISKEKYSPFFVLVKLKSIVQNDIILSNTYVIVMRSALLLAILPKEERNLFTILNTSDKQLFKFFSIISFAKTKNGLIIEHKNQNVEIEASQNIIDDILSNIEKASKEKLGIQIPVKDITLETRFERKEMLHLMVSLNDEHEMFFDNNMIVDEVKNFYHVIRLIELKNIFIREGTQTSSLYLNFLNGFCREFQNTPNKIDCILTCIIQAFLSKEISETLFLNSFLLNIPTLLCSTDTDTANYEAQLYKEISEGSNEEVIIPAIIDSSINMSFKFNQNWDIKFFNQLINIMSLKFEQVFLLDKNYENYISIIGKQEGELNETQIKIINSYKQLHLALILLKNFIISKPNSLTDFQYFEKSNVLLLKLSKLLNMTLSLQSSLCIRALFKKLDYRKVDLSFFSSILIPIYNLSMSSLNEYVKLQSIDFSLNLEVSHISHFQIVKQLIILESILYKEQREPSEEVKNLFLTGLKKMTEFFLLVNNCLFHSPSVVLTSSIVSLKLLICIFNFLDKEKWLEIQQFLLAETLLFPIHINLICTHVFPDQRLYSSSILSLIITGNPHAITLIKKIFPSFILKKADTLKTQLIEWKRETWRELFILIKTNYSSTTEQWNEESKKELRLQILQLIRILCAKLQKGEKFCWNFQEFDIDYKSISSKIKVWKYYLKILNNIKDGNLPYLNDNIQEPNKFWDKLTIRLVNTTNIEEKKNILITMLLIYKDHFQLIKKVNILPHLIQSLTKIEDKEIHPNILEFFSIALGISHHETVMQTVRTMYKCNFLNIIFTILCQSFPSLKTKKVEENPNENSGEKNEQKTKKRNKYRKATFIFSILEKLFKATDNKDIIPISIIREYCLRENIFNIIAQSYFFHPVNLRKRIIKFILTNFSNPESIVLMKNSGFVDFLFLNIDPKIAKDVLSFVEKIDEIALNYNSDILDQITDFNDKYIVEKYDKVKHSILLRYFPFSVTKYIVERGADAGSKLLMTENSKDPHWNIYCLDLMRKKLEENVQDFQKSKLKNNSIETNSKYTNPLNKLIYYEEVNNQIRAGFFFLNQMVNPNSFNPETFSSKDSEIFIDNFEKSFGNFVSSFDGKSLKILAVYIECLKSYFTQFKQFSDYFTLFSCLEILIKDYENEEYTKVIKNILKIIFLAKALGNINFIDKWKVNYNDLFLKILKYHFQKDLSKTTNLQLKCLRYINLIFADLLVINPMILNGSNSEVIIEILKISNNISISMVQYILDKVENYKNCADKNDSKTKYKLTGGPAIFKEKSNNETDKLKSLGEIDLNNNEYFLSQFIITIDALLRFVVILSEIPLYIISFIKSLIIWNSFKVINFMEQKNYSVLKASLNLEFIIGLHLIPFRNYVFYGISVRNNSIKSLEEEQQKQLEIQTNCLMKLFGESILIHTLLSGIENSPSKAKHLDLKKPIDSILNMIAKLKMDIKNPTLLWDKSSKKELDELLKIIFNQTSLEDICKLIESFNYTICKNEIIVDNIYLRIYNTDPFFNLSNPARTVGILVEEISKYPLSKIIESKEIKQKVEILIEALGNINNFQGEIETSLMKNKIFETLCNLVYTKESQFQESLTLISTSILDQIFIHCSEKVQVSGLLINIKEFQTFIIQVLYDCSNNLLLSKVSKILTNFVRSGLFDQLADMGIYLYIMRILLTPPKIDEEILIDYFNILKQLVVRISVVKEFLTTLLVPEIINNITNDSKKTSKDWISFFVSDYSTVTLIWNGKLRKETIQVINEEVNLQFHQYRSEGFSKTKLTKLKLYPNIEEIVVSGIVLRMFIARPNVEIPVLLDNFIESICEKISKKITVIQSVMNEKQITLSNMKSKSFNNMNIEEIILTNQNELLILFTSLLLAIEQQMKNVYNNNKKTVVTRTSSPIAEGIFSTFAIDFIKTFVKITLNELNISEIKIILLQILFLSLSYKQYFSVDDYKLIIFQLIQCFHTIDQYNSQQLIEIEQILCFLVMSKIVDAVNEKNKKNDICDTIISGNIVKIIKEHYENSPGLRNFIKFLFCKIYANLFYGNPVKKDPLFSLGEGASANDILNHKYELYPNLWRKSPMNLNDSLIIYSKYILMEEIKLNESSQSTFPIISKKVFIQRNYFEAHESLLSLFN